MLTKQLRELEADQIVHCKIYAEVPPRIEYSLTEFGKTLLPIVSALEQWGETYPQRLGVIRNQNLTMNNKTS